MTDSGKSVLERLVEAERIAEIIGELRDISHEDLQIFAASLILDRKGKLLEEFATKVEMDGHIRQKRKLLDELKKARNSKGAAD
jgi:hypothetical protein